MGTQTPVQTPMTSAETVQASIALVDVEDFVTTFTIYDAVLVTVAVIVSVYLLWSIGIMITPVRIGVALAIGLGLILLKYLMTKYTFISKITGRLNTRHNA